METIPDFVEEILTDCETAEEEKKYELDLTQSDYLLMAIARLENKMSDVNETADGEILTIEKWREKELLRLDKRRSWLIFNLSQFIRQTARRLFVFHTVIFDFEKGRIGQ